MSVVAKIASYQVAHLLRSKWFIAYFLLLLLVTELLLRLSADSAQLLSLLSSGMLLIVPTISLILGTTHFYNAREFTELILAQPIRRRSVFAGLYLGLAAPLALVFCVATGLPILIHGVSAVAHYRTFLLLAFMAALLTCSFAGIAFLIACAIADKARGLGTAILVWLAAALLYDVVVLAAVIAFSDYPLEPPLLVLMFLNPIDLARTLLLLQMDMAALMGYTGAVFEKIFRGALGAPLAVTGLLVWAVLPVYFAARLFQRRDF